MILPLILLILKEIFDGFTGMLIIRKTSQVPSARWHGKAATSFLYIMMLVHILWQDIPQLASDLSIVTCIVMMTLSLILYGKHNIQKLRGDR